MKASAPAFVPTFLREGAPARAGQNPFAAHSHKAGSGNSDGDVFGFENDGDDDGGDDDGDDDLDFDDLMFVRGGAQSAARGGRHHHSNRRGLPPMVNRRSGAPLHSHVQLPGDVPVPQPHEDDVVVLSPETLDGDEFLEGVAEAVAELSMPHVETVQQHHHCDEEEQELIAASGGLTSSSPSSSLPPQQDGVALVDADRGESTPASADVPGAAEAEEEQRVIRCGSVEIGHDGVIDSSQTPAHGNVCMDDFEPLTVIGRGAFGKVYLVRSRHDRDQLFAMKVLKKGYMIRVNNVRETRAERSILTRVRHPFSVSLHFAFQDEHALHLVMDYCAGGQLFFHLREEAMLSEEWVRFYAAEMLLAIEHLHALGIIHREYVSLTPPVTHGRLHSLCVRVSLTHSLSLFHSQPQTGKRLAWCGRPHLFNGLRFCQGRHARRSREGSGRVHARPDEHVLRHAVLHGTRDDQGYQTGIQVAFLPFPGVGMLHCDAISGSLTRSVFLFSLFVC
jgi:Protein kinase domain